jgi:hypothetical protein
MRVERGRARRQYYLEKLREITKKLSQNTWSAHPKDRFGNSAC